MKKLKKLQTIGSDTMLLAVMVWLCTLPLIGIFVLPYFGVKGALIGAGILLILALLVCWGICGWQSLEK
jgi:hypothetical protein